MIWLGPKSARQRWLFNASAVLAALAAVDQPRATETLSATSAPASAMRSVVIVTVRDPRYREDLEIVHPGEPDNPQGLSFQGVFEGEATVLRTLSGPPLDKHSRILFVANHVPFHRDLKLFMVVGRDEFGDLWAGENWTRVASAICLSRDDVAGLGLEGAFTKARTNRQGLLCINA